MRSNGAHHARNGKSGTKSMTQTMGVAMTVAGSAQIGRAGPIAAYAASVWIGIA